MDQGQRTDGEHRKREPGKEAQWQEARSGQLRETAEAAEWALFGWSIRRMRGGWSFRWMGGIFGRAFTD
ncbi:hypothetical protein GCM10027402_23580 [Arthrobacter monumenti]